MTRESRERLIQIIGRLEVLKLFVEEDSAERVIDSSIQDLRDLLDNEPETHCIPKISDDGKVFKIAAVEAADIKKECLLI